MKILFLIRSLGYGGAEGQLVALAKGLHRLGHTVTVAQFYGGYPREAELQSAGVPVRSLGKRGRWDVAGFFARLIRLVREEKPDVVHSYLADPNILAVLLKPVSPRTRIVWGVRASARDFSRYEPFVRVAFRAQCALSRFADLVIANSFGGRADHLARGFPADKTVVIHNGIDSDRFRPDPEARRRARSEFGVSDDQPLIGLIGRLDPMKDHESFLRAASLVLGRGIDARFLCVGNGSEAERKRLGSIGEGLGLADALTWSAARGDVDAVYNALDILVSSSRWGEGFSNVIGEVMACGVPCVVTDVGDSKLIVAGAGVVVRPGDPTGLADGIVSLLAEDRDAMARRRLEARERVVSEFSVEAMVSRTEHHLLRLLSGLAVNVA